MGGEGQLFITVKFKWINIEGVMETLIKYYSNNYRQELSMDAEVSGWKLDTKWYVAPPQTVFP